MNNILEIKSLYKSFGEIEVLRNISFNIAYGEFIGFFGPNGCGKTTLLNIISGIEQPTKGEIIYGNETNSFSIVFQDYDKSLMPWKTCLYNIAFPLEKDERLTKKQRINKVKDILNDLDLNHLPLNNYPYQMSGGEKQLTCIARSLVTDPDIILFDEPFASLDFQTRLEMNYTVRKIWEKTKKTFLFVSHDIGEAIYLSNKLFLLSKRPTKIKNEFNIDLPIERPRPLEIENSMNYNKIKHSIVNEFSSIIVDRNEIN